MLNQHDQAHITYSALEDGLRYDERYEQVILTEEEKHEDVRGAHCTKCGTQVLGEYDGLCERCV